MTNGEFGGGREHFLPAKNNPFTSNNEGEKKLLTQKEREGLGLIKEPISTPEIDKTPLPTLGNHSLFPKDVADEIIGEEREKARKRREKLAQDKNEPGQGAIVPGELYVEDLGFDPFENPGEHTPEGEWIIDFNELPEVEDVPFTAAEIRKNVKFIFSIAAQHNVYIPKVLRILINKDVEEEEFKVDFSLVKQNQEVQVFIDRLKKTGKIPDEIYAIMKRSA